MDHGTHTTARRKSIWPMFVGAFVIFAVFAVFVQWMVSSGDRASFDEEAIRSKERYEILRKINEENAGLTTGYAWADRAKGTVRIPLDRAVEMAAAKLSAQGEPKPAGAIDPNVPHASAVKPGGLAAPQPTPPLFNAPPAPAATNAPAQP
jgi:hypothetical protein